MSSRSQTSPVLLVLILVITFPIWITIGAVLFGVVAGLFGAVIGIFAGIVGVLIGALLLPFKILFGWGDWGFHAHNHTYMILAAILIAALLIRRKRSSN
jgi:hypothetical protein